MLYVGKPFYSLKLIIKYQRIEREWNKFYEIPAEYSMQSNDIFD